VSVFQCVCIFTVIRSTDLGYCKEAAVHTALNTLIIFANRLLSFVSLFFPCPRVLFFIGMSRSLSVF